MKIRLILFFLVISSNLITRASDIFDGLRTFGEQKYDSAIFYFQREIDDGSTWDWLPQLIETVEKRKLLGEIAPEYVHQVGVIFVTELNITKPDQSIETLTDVTPEQKAEWIVYFKALGQVLESFSDGEWSLDFDTVSTVSNYLENAELMPDNPDHLDLEEYFLINTERFDSFITLSNKRSPARGLARAYPNIHGVIYGPSRGMAALNAGSHGFSTLLHEYFHIVEWVSNAIGKAHGYREAERVLYFPEWTGDTEYDYYRWHFSDTLSAIGWNRLNHSLRWIPYNWSEDEFEQIRNVYKDIPLEDRQYARVLYDSAQALKSIDMDAAVLIFKESLSLSPYYEKSLIEMFEYYKIELNDTAAAGQYLPFLKQIRRINDYYTIDTLTYDNGEVIGLWHREDVSESGDWFEWDISQYLDSTGIYEVIFFYTRGWKALATDSVYLIEDGGVVSSDLHEGFTGSARTETTNVYKLVLPEYITGKEYKLRARLFSKGGTDSFGQIQIRYAGPGTLIPEENNIENAVMLYPNPVTDILYISSQSQITSLKIYSITGNLVYSNLNLRGYQLKHDVYTLAPGIYLTEVSTLSGPVTLKWIKD